MVRLLQKNIKLISKGEENHKHVKKLENYFSEKGKVILHSFPRFRQLGPKC